MARRRRSRARENPSTGFWIAVGVGVVAVGGVAYVMTRPAAAATPSLPPSPAHPVNDAATYSPAAAAAAASAASSAASQAAGGTSTVTFTANGRTMTSPYVPNSANLANDMHQALAAANVGHGAGKEGEAWVARAKVDGAGASEFAQLRAAGYAV